MGGQKPGPFPANCPLRYVSSLTPRGAISLFYMLQSVKIFLDLAPWSHVPPPEFSQSREPLTSRAEKSGAQAPEDSGCLQALCARLHGSRAAQHLVADQNMPRLSYPVVFECAGCSRETTVTRDTARSLYPDPDSSNAPEVVLQERGWMEGPGGNLYCPDCGRSAGR